jgi:hypothetical protein
MMVLNLLENIQLEPVKKMVYGLEQCLYVKVNKIKIFIRLSDNKNKRVDWFTNETASELLTIL